MRPAARYAVRPFVHVQKVSNTVPCAMAVVKLARPKPSSGQDVYVSTVDLVLLWELKPLDV